MSVPQAGGGPITSKADLIDFLAVGAKPKSEWRIGTEHEKFGYNLKTLAPLPYEGRPGIKACWRACGASVGSRSTKARTSSA